LPKRAVSSLIGCLKGSNAV